MNKKQRKKANSILKRIRQKIEATHWTQRVYHRKEGGKDLYCIVGMVNVATGIGNASLSSEAHDPSYLPDELALLRRDLLTTLRDAVPKSGVRSMRPVSLEAFNDAGRTTKAQMLKVVDTAIEMTESS